MDHLVPNIFDQDNHMFYMIMFMDYNFLTIWNQLTLKISVLTCLKKIIIRNNETIELIYCKHEIEFIYIYKNIKDSALVKELIANWQHKKPDHLPQ